MALSRTNQVALSESLRDILAMIDNFEGIGPSLHFTRQADRFEHENQVNSSHSTFAPGFRMRGY